MKKSQDAFLTVRAENKKKENSAASIDTDTTAVGKNKKASTFYCLSIKNLTIRGAVSIHIVYAWENQSFTSESTFISALFSLITARLLQCALMLSVDTEWGNQRNPGSPVSVSERGCLRNCRIYNWTVNSLAQVTFLLVRTNRLKKGQAGSWEGMMEVEPSLWPHCTGELVETELCSW